MKIIIGEFTECNRYRKEKLVEGYIRQYIKEFSSLNYFFSWTKGIGRPVMGNHYLVFVHDRDTFVRNPSKLIKQFESVENLNPYVDVIWIVDRGSTIKNLVISAEVINLKAEFKSDFKFTVLKDLPNLTEKGFKALTKSIGYSWQTYTLYRDELIESNPIDDKDIRQVLKIEKFVSASEVLIKVLLRKRFALQAYTKLCLKYSERWVARYFGDELDKIIDIKLKLANRKVSYHKIGNNKDLVKYIGIISNTPIADVFLLKILSSRQLGIQMYLNYSTLEIFKKYDEDYMKGAFS